MISQIRNNLLLDAQEEYNCSLADINGVPIDWESRGDAHMAFGLLCIAYAFVAIPLYYVTATIIWSMRKTHTYKIMFYLAVSDIGTLFCNSLIFGVLLMNGEVYCKHPKLNFAYAIIAMFFFISSCCTCMMLAFNRFIEFLSQKWLRIIFDGSKTWFLLSLPFSYAVFSALFTPLFFFDSVTHTVQVNPRITDKYEYYSYFHIFNNVMNPIVIFSLYLIMLLHVMVKFRKVIDLQQANSVNRAALMLTIQSGIVITVHMATCLVYELIQFIEATHMILYAAHVGWMLIHGIPPIIYMLFNASIRHALLALGGTHSQATVMSLSHPSTKQHHERERTAVI